MRTQYFDNETSIVQSMRTQYFDHVTNINQSYFSVDEFTVNYGAADRKFAENKVKHCPTTTM